jgi:GNAT superfamily N-acetyltransferase
VRRSISELCVDDHQGDRATIEAWLHNKTVANFAAWIASVEHVARIALDERGPQGFALLNRSGTVALLYVTPAARFHGVSKALLASVEHAAAELGLDELSLVSTSTAAALLHALRLRGSGRTAPRFRCYGVASDGEENPPVLVDGHDQRESETRSHCFHLPPPHAGEGIHG